MDSAAEINKLQDEFAGAKKLLDTAHGLWRAQVLSSAIEVELFDFLETDTNRSKSEAEIREKLEINALRTEDFLNALVAMGHILRDEQGYSNSEDASKFCVSSNPNNIA